MRQARITYEGAIHHAINRGHNGLPIFKSEIEKEKILELLEKNVEKCKVSIIAYWKSLIEEKRDIVLRV